MAMIFCPVCCDDRYEGHRHCASCGAVDASGMCLHHASDLSDNWSEANRIWCDLLHRGIEPPRLPAEERREFWETAAADAAAWAG